MLFFLLQPVFVTNDLTFFAIRFFFKIPTLIGIMSIVYAQMMLTS